MSFRLKNAGATYQWLMDKVFMDQLGLNIEVYIDDILVKSLLVGNLILDLEETFSTLRKYRMKLNPEKCIFRVTKRRFLRYMVTEWGIKDNLKKIDTIQQMQPPINL